MKVVPIKTETYQLQSRPTVSVNIPTEAAHIGRSIVDKVMGESVEGFVKALQEHREVLSPTNLRLNLDVLALIYASKADVPLLQDRIMLCLGIDEYWKKREMGSDPIGPSEPPDYLTSPLHSGADLIRLYEELSAGR